MESDGYGDGDEGFRSGFGTSSWSIYENQEVLARYEVLDHIGSGAYSDVYRGKRREDGAYVALKEVHDNKSSVRELAALRLLKGSSNVVQLLDYFWQSPGILFVLEFLPGSLSEVIEKQKGRPFPDAEVKTWMVQILRGVAACHSAGVLHRDLKPSNLLIGADGVLKVADFGTARIVGGDGAVLPQTDEVVSWKEAAQATGKKLENDEIERWLEAGAKLKEPEIPVSMMHSNSYDRLDCELLDNSSLGGGTEVSPRVSDVDADVENASGSGSGNEEDAQHESNSEWYPPYSASNEHPGQLTDCVGTRWYKAPELLYGSGSYTFAVDLWALGCIFGELLQGEPLFPGASDIDQLSRIVRVLGVPSEATWPGVSELPDFDKICFNDDREPVTLARHAFRASKVACKLLEKFLIYPPDCRLAASDALRDNYFVDDLDLGHSSGIQQQQRDKAAIEAWLTAGRS